MKILSTRALLTIPLLYIGCGVLLFLAQNHLIYLPDNRPFGECAQAPATVTLVEEATWRGYYTPAPDEVNERIVIVYHGNAGNACHRTALLPTLQAHDHAVLIVEYPGFADTHTHPRTKDSLAIISDVQEFISQSDYTDITIFGESIGSGFASYHAHEYAPQSNLILITPFARLSDRAQEAIPIYPVRWLLRTDLDTATWATAATHVTIIAAEYDQVMPRRHTDRLVAALAEEKVTYHTIPDTNHNSLYSAPVFHQAIKAALE